LSIFIYLPFFIAFFFLFSRSARLNKLKLHVKETYPDEWDKLCENKMAMKASTAQTANLEESMKNGFLSKQKDPLINRFYFKDRLSLISMVLFVAIQFVLVILI